MSSKTVLILTDSIANPRSFPKIDATGIDETYPYILRKTFPDYLFWQLSLGDATSSILYSQAVSYLNQSNPEFIIIHAGLNDCRPKMPSLIIRKLLNFLPFLRKRMAFNSRSNVSKSQFQRTVKKFKANFPKANILWLEICAGKDYHNDRPGFEIHSNEFNKILSANLNQNFVLVYEKILDIGGFNSDQLHWNKKAHKIVGDILIKKIQNAK